MKYELVRRTDDENGVIMRTDADGFIDFVPIDEGNIDYQAYLVWLSEQSEA